MPEGNRISNPPLIAGTILGVRIWRTDMGLCSLRSSSTGARWQTHGGATAAVCVRHDNRYHRVPGKECTCGLYAHHAYRFPPQILRRLHRPDPRTVVGFVEAWGRIELHLEGFRAEFARPVAFINFTWPKPKEDEDPRWYGTRKRRCAYECRLIELAERCGAEVIDCNKGDKLGAWIHDDPRALRRETLARLIPRRRRSPRRS